MWTVAGSCKRSNSTRGEEYLDRLRDSHLMKKDSAPSPLVRATQIPKRIFHMRRNKCLLHIHIT
jgi:hypothetical protein